MSGAGVNTLMRRQDAEDYLKHSKCLTSGLNRSFASVGILTAMLFLFCGCNDDSGSFAVIHADRSVSVPSAYPIAIEPARIGEYPPETKSGAGYFYDDVLEYRVWLHPEDGASPLNGGDDYFMAFAQYERAAEFSQKTKGAEEPLVLVRQLEWIDEPKPGQYIAKNAARITEWQVRWLAGRKRTTDSIKEFIKHPRPARE